MISLSYQCTTDIEAYAYTRFKVRILLYRALPFRGPLCCYVTTLILWWRGGYFWYNLNSTLSRIVMLMIIEYYDVYTGSIHYHLCVILILLISFLCHFLFQLLYSRSISQWQWSHSKTQWNACRNSPVMLPFQIPAWKLFVWFAIVASTFMKTLW